MNNRLIRSVLFCLASILPFCTIAQDIKDLTGDSLIEQLNKTASDTARLRLHLEAAKYFSEKDFKKSLSHALEAEKLATSLGKTKELGEAVNYAGIAYFYVGLLEESARFRTRYIELKKHQGTDFEKTTAYANLASIWVMKGDYGRADSLFKIALYFLENMQNEKEISDLEKTKSFVSLYNNMGIVYREKGNLDLASYYNEKGITLSKSNPTLKIDLIRLLNNHSAVIAKKGKYEEAISLLDDALDSSLQLNDNSMIMTCYYSKAKIYQQTGEIGKAIENAYLGMHIAQEMEGVSSISTFAETIYNLYKTSGKSDSALKYLSVMQKYDSIIRIEAAKDLLLQQEIRDVFSVKESNNKKQYTRELYTWGAVALFLLLPSAFFTIKYFLNRRRLQMTHLEALRSKLDAEKLALEKELLTTEIEQKEKKLATNVMYQLQKNEMLRDVAQKLLAFAKESKAESSESILTIIKDLEKATEQNIWEEFELRFQEVHRTFYEKLQQQFPDLSPNERRLCAFLRLNMSSKEISTITGQSIHSIQVARTRLRKKLQLTHSDQGLIEFLAGL